METRKRRHLNNMRTEREIVKEIANLSENIAIMEEKRTNTTYPSCNPQTEAIRNAEKCMREALLWLFEDGKELPF